jgi:hypothetical protein
MKSFLERYFNVWQITGGISVCRDIIQSSFKLAALHRFWSFFRHVHFAFLSFVVFEKNVRRYLYVYVN